MHNSQLFQNQGVQSLPPLDVYDLNLIAPQFNGWSFGLGHPWDQATPRIALMAIQEIQQQAQKRHPIREGFFNIISDNAFDNQMFQDMLQVIVIRSYQSTLNNEFRTIDAAVKKTIEVAVKAFACALAGGDPEFMATLKEDEQRAVRENTDVWNHLVAVANNQAPFVPFNQMGVNTGLTQVSNSTQSALEAARTIGGSRVGGFTEGGYTPVQNSTHNNNATGGGGRYARKAEHLYGKLEGAMQEALVESGVAAAPAAPYQSRMRRNNAPMQEAPARTAPPLSFAQAATKQAAAKFDSDVTDFSKSMDTTSVAAPVPAKTLFVVKFGTAEVEIVAERKEGYSAWKSSDLQPFHPAWCKRTQCMRYFETRDGIVIAAPQNLKEEEKEIAMNYDAHAIDPTKGKPLPSVPVKPVREEAKVLYQDAKTVKINIVVEKTSELVEDVAGAMRSARQNGQMSKPTPDAYTRVSQVNTAVIYDTAEDAKEDEIMIRAISNSKTFAEAATYLPQVKNDMARQIINRTLVKAINRATECEMGLGIRIGDFQEDGAEIVGFIGNKKGALVGEKLAAQQTAILQANVRVCPASAIQDYADATLAPAGEEKLGEETTARILFLQQNVIAVWVNFTDNELAIGLPPKGAAPIPADSMGALYNIAKTVYAEGIGGVPCAEQFLITKDAVCYSLHRGILNREFYLLSKKVD
jgi:hypothetical protein